MQLDLALIAIGIAGVGFLLVYARSYIRTINSLSAHLNREKLNSLHPTSNWLWRMLFLDFFVDPSPFFMEKVPSSLILGLRELDQSDECSRLFLRRARNDFIVCLLSFTVAVTVIGFLFRAR